MGTRNLHKPFRLKRERDGRVKMSRKASSRRLVVLEQRVSALELRAAIEREIAAHAMASQHFGWRHNRDGATKTPAGATSRPAPAFDPQRFAANLRTEQALVEQEMRSIGDGASPLVAPTKYERWSKIASDAFNQAQLAARPMHRRLYRRVLRMLRQFPGSSQKLVKQPAPGKNAGDA